MQSILLILVLDQIKEVACAIMGTRGESHVVIPPVDAPDLAIVALNLPIAWHLSSVKVVHMDEIAGAHRGRKQVTSIAELDLSALLDGDAGVLLDALG